jgi:Trk-type K+ transport system membrane component
MLLVILGGLGFPTLTGISSFVLATLRREPNRRISIHIRVVLISSAVLLLAGAILFWLLESKGALGALDWKSQWRESLFHSVVSRTAGFNTLALSELTGAALFLTIVLMWIGASPNSTGGGIKTTTATLALLNIYALASGRNKVELFRRRIPDTAVARAFSATLLSLLYIALALFSLLISEEGRGFKFESLLFEVVSAVSTVGLTTGVTPNLSDAGKAIVICSMVIGRVGFLSVMVALTKPRPQTTYDYAEESILVS